MSETKATIRGDTSDIRSMIRRTALDGDASYAELYMNVLPGKVEFIKSTSGNAVATYTTFMESYFNDITVESDVETESLEESGVEFDFNVGAEAILNVEQILKYLDYVTDSGQIELEFVGEEDRRLCTTLRLDGMLEGWLNLPGSQSILDNVPFWITQRYDDEDTLVAPNGNEAPTQIETGIEQIQNIVDIVDGNPSEDYYPIVVDDGELLIDVGSEGSSGVRGSLRSAEVIGPDVDNTYFKGFSETVELLSGKVSLYTAPDGNPVSFVDDSEDGVVLRHLCGSVAV